MRWLPRLVPALLLLLPRLGEAAPVQLTHQARLAAADGVPLNGAATIGVTLWSAASGGAQVWGDVFTGVPVADGYFTVRLGSGAPLDSADLLGGDRYVQIAVDGLTLGQRTQLVDVPYAAVAHSVALGAATACDAARAGALRFQGGAFSGCDGTRWVALSGGNPILGAPGPCDPDHAGALAWDAGAQELQLCDGAAWRAAFAAADVLPDPLGFQDVTGAALGSAVNSGPVTLSGVTQPVLLAVAGDGNPEIRAAGGAWGNTASAGAGDAIEVRLTTPEDGGATAEATVSAGGVELGTFSVTTSAATSCEALFQDGHTGDGDYLVDTDGAAGVETLLVTCDMDRDGGGWAVYGVDNIQGSSWTSVDPNATVESATSYRCGPGTCTNVFPVPYDVTEWVATVQVGDSIASDCNRARWTGQIAVGTATATFSRTSAGNNNSSLQLFGVLTQPSPQFDESRKRFRVRWRQGVDLSVLLTDLDSGTTWSRTDPNTTSTAGSVMSLVYSSSDTRCGSWQNADRRLVVEELAFR